MILTMLLLMAAFLAVFIAVFVYVTYVKPRQVQERVWRTVATELGADVVDHGFIRGLAFRAPVGDAAVAVLRSNIGAVDGEAGRELERFVTDNSLRTYLSANTLPCGSPTGPCFVTRDESRALLGNDPAAMERALDQLAPLLSLVRPKIERLVVGRQQVDLKLTDNAVGDEATLRAAIELVGRLAGGVPRTVPATIGIAPAAASALPA